MVHNDLPDQSHDAFYNENRGHRLGCNILYKKHTYEKYNVQCHQKSFHQTITTHYYFPSGKAVSQVIYSTNKSIITISRNNYAILHSPQKTKA